MCASAGATLPGVRRTDASIDAAPLVGKSHAERIPHCAYATVLVRITCYFCGVGDARMDIGAAGERVAAAFLARHGVRIERRNVKIGRGEVDLIGVLGATRFLIEVRSRVAEFAPIEAFDYAKRERLRRLSREIGIDRVDLVAVGFGEEFVSVHWIPAVL